MSKDKLTDNPETAVAARFDALERKVDRLLDICQQLSDENASLKATQEQLVAERAALVSKSEQARSRVEAMIARLKALEQGA